MKKSVIPPFLVVSGGENSMKTLIIILARISKEGIESAQLSGSLKVRGAPFMMASPS